MNGESKWATRFIIAAIVQGSAATIITALLIIPGLLTPAPSRVIASGGAGTWLLAGYMGYIVVGVIAVAVTALFYHYLEVVLQRRFKTINNILAGIHLLGMNMGVAGATWLMMLAGFAGGGSTLPIQQGGLGYNAQQAHQVIVSVADPLLIAGFIGLAGLGVLLGGVGYIRAMLEEPESVAL